jgi:hypothetical protein
MPVPTMKDAPQALRYAYDDDAKALRIAGSLVPEAYDTLELEYIVAGNGTGEIGIVTYILDLTIIATLTLTYDVSNRLISVVRT